MNRLIHVLFAILPLATHADTWLSGGEAVIPPAVVVSPDNLGNHTATGTLDMAGNTVSNVNRIQAADTGGDLAGAWTLNGAGIGVGGAADNLGDHTATGALNMATFAISNAGPINVMGGGMSGGFALRAIYGGPGAFDMPQFGGGSPYDDVGLWPWGASDGNVLAYSSLYDAWVPTAPAGGGGSGDNLGDHVATNTLDLGTNRINVNVEGGMVPWQLGAVLDEGGIYPMPQFRGMRSGSPYAAGLMLAGANDGDVLAWDAIHGWYRPLPAGGADNLGNHTASQFLDMLTNPVVLRVEGGMYPWQLASTSSPQDISYAIPAFHGYVAGVPATVGLMPWGAQNNDTLAFDATDNIWKPVSGALGGLGSALLGMDAVDPDNGEDVFIRAGSVRDPFTLMGQPGTTYIQGATNGVANKQGAVVIQTHGGESFNGLSGGDITIQSGNGGSMGGSNGVIRIIPGFGDPADSTPRLLMGNKDAGHYVEFDGDQLMLYSSGCSIRFVAPEGPGTGWMEITQGSVTKLTFTNDTILIDGSPVYTGTPGGGQTPVFTKGFCTGVTP